MHNRKIILWFAICFWENDLYLDAIDQYQLTFISGKKLKRKNNCSSFNLVRITQKRPESRNQSKTWNQVKNELQSNDSIESVLKNELQWLTL